jgi:hypothetical protein
MEFINQYAAWVKANPDAARNMEDIAKMGGMFAPAGLGEVAFAATNVLGLLNDAVLLSIDRPGEGVAVKQSRWLLSILASVDVLLEVIAHSVGGTMLKHNVIILVEAVRAAAKLHVLISSQERIQVGGGTATAALPKRPKKPDTASGEGTAAAAEASPVGALGALWEGLGDTPDNKPTKYWRGNLSGITIPLPDDYVHASTSGTSPGLGAPSIILSTWQERLNVLLQQLQKAGRIIAANPRTPTTTASALLHQLDAAASPAVYPAGATVSADSGALCEDDEATPLRLLGEVAYILRPLLFAILKGLFGGRSWIPLIASLATDAFSARCTVMATSRSAGEAEEFIPRYATEAVKNSAESVQVAVSALLNRVFGDKITLVPSLTPGGTPVKFAFPNPPGQGGDSALQKALASPKAGVGGLLLRFGLWLVQSSPNATGAEAEELRRRRMLWAFYLLRSPLFQTVTAPSADVVISVGSWVPLMGTLLRYSKDILASLNAHHFYTSASS